MPPQASDGRQLWGDTGRGPVAWCAGEEVLPAIANISAFMLEVGDGDGGQPETGLSARPANLGRSLHEVAGPPHPPFRDATGGDPFRQNLFGVPRNCWQKRGCRCHDSTFAWRAARLEAQTPPPTSLTRAKKLGLNWASLVLTLGGGGSSGFASRTDLGLGNVSTPCKSEVYKLPSKDARRLPRRSVFCR